MGEKIYAVSDIHGHLDALRAALDIVSLGSDPDARLVLLGDYVDRGPESAGVLYAIRNLQREFGDRVVVLQGNHDVWLTDWAWSTDDDDTSWLDADLGQVTTRSLVPESVFPLLPWDNHGATLNRLVKEAVLSEHHGVLAWLRRQPLVYETETQIFVHAGVDELAGAFWRAATPEYWFTDKYPASTGSFVKTIVAGHVRTAALHQDGSHGVFHDGKSHYYIDAAVEVTGQLNVLCYDCERDEYSWTMTPAQPQSTELK